MLQFKNYSLKLNEPFGTAHGIREKTDGVLVKLTNRGTVGYGEVFMPPYYPENQESMGAFFEKIDPLELLAPPTIGESLEILEAVAPKNRGAKAAIDIALHDLSGKLKGQSYLTMYPGFEGIEDMPPSQTSYTIGFDNVEKMVEKAAEAEEFGILKIKLNGENDIEIIRRISVVAKDKILYVDANQGWKELDKAIETSKAIIELGVRLIEQPFPTGRFDDVIALRNEVSVPLIADEDLQTWDQLRDIASSYDGVNIKIMKAGGIKPAIQLFSSCKTSWAQGSLGLYDGKLDWYQCSCETQCGSGLV